jgi:hypothetical protein
VESSVHRLSTPNTYSYAQEEKLGLTRKLEEDYDTYCLRVLLSNNFLHYTCGAWMGEQGTAKKKVPPAHA